MAIGHRAAARSVLEGRALPCHAGRRWGSTRGIRMQNQLFEAALGIAKPWYVNGVDFDAARKTLTIGVDFAVGTRFAAAGVAGVHPVHDTQIKRLRHLNFF